MSQNTVRLADHLDTYLPCFSQLRGIQPTLTGTIVENWSDYNIHIPEDSKPLMDRLDRFLENQADALFVSQVGRWIIEEMEIHFNLPFGFTIVYRAEDHHNYGIRCAFVPVGTGVKVLGGVSYNQLVHIPNLSMYPITAVSEVLVHWGRGLDWYVPTMPTSVHAYPWPDDCFAYPIVEPMFDLKSEHCTREYAMFARITDYIKSRSYEDWAYLFNSGNGCSDINAPRFRIRAHNYNGEQSDWNLVWRDVSINWYKHYNCSLRISRGMTDEEIELMESEIMAFLETYTFPFANSKPPAPPTPEKMQAVADKLLRNGRSGAFSRGVGNDHPIMTNSLYGAMGSDDLGTVHPNSLEALNAVTQFSNDAAYHTLDTENQERVATCLIPQFTDDTWRSMATTSLWVKPNAPFEYFGINNLDGKPITDDEINIGLRALRHFHSVNPLTVSEMAVVAEAIQLLRKSQELGDDSHS